MSKLNNLLISIISGVFKRKEALPLHALLWTIDAQFHQIPTIEDINNALIKCMPFKIIRNESEVILIQDNKSKIDKITESDLTISIAKYNSMIDLKDYKK